MRLESAPPNWKAKQKLIAQTSLQSETVCGSLSGQNDGYRWGSSRIDRIDRTWLAPGLGPHQRIVGTHGPRYEKDHKAIAILNRLVVELVQLMVPVSLIPVSGGVATLRWRGIGWRLGAMGRQAVAVA